MRTTDGVAGTLDDGDPEGSKRVARGITDLFDEGGVVTSGLPAAQPEGGADDAKLDSEQF